MNCGGTEARLFDCRASPLGVHNCEHSEDAGVRCFTGIYINFTIVAPVVVVAVVIVAPVVAHVVVVAPGEH